MKNTKLVAGVIVVLVVIVGAFFLFNGDKESESGKEAVRALRDGTPIVSTVESVDGGAMIEIPEGALPEGMSADELSIVLAEDIEDLNVVLYKLLPDGAQFNGPVRVTLITEASPDGEYEIPLLFHISGEGDEQTIEVIAQTEVLIDEESGKLAIAGEVSHFSSIVRYRIRGLFTVTPTSKTTKHSVGETFEVTGTIKPNKKTINIKELKSYFRASSDFVYAPGSTWGADGWLETYYTTAIKPHTREVLDRRGLTIHQPFNFKVEFTCEKEADEAVTSKSGGDGLSVTYTVNETEKYYIGGEWTIKEPVARKIYTYVYFKEPHQCVALKKEESSSSSIQEDPKPGSEAQPKIEAPEFGGQLEIRGGIFGE